MIIPKVIVVIIIVAIVTQAAILANDTVEEKKSNSKFCEKNNYEGYEYQNGCAVCYKKTIHPSGVGTMKEYTGCIE